MLLILSLQREHERDELPLEAGDPEFFGASSKVTDTESERSRVFKKNAHYVTNKVTEKPQ